MFQKKVYNLSMKDKIQAQLTLLQVLFAAMAILNIVLIGWLATENGANAGAVIWRAATSVCLSIGIVYVSNHVMNKIDELEYL
jgi:hypothetical protein